MRTVKFGVIGCGLMGREFASAAARWRHLNADLPHPEIVAVADINPANARWFTQNTPKPPQVFEDYRALLALEEVEAVYAAVPHLLHQQVYTDCIRAGKHLMGEKPFGMDKAQNDAILLELSKHPGLIVRCASEFPYFPAMQTLLQWIREHKFGRILEIRCGFHHSSDMDPAKPINWKRQASVNGAYGCMGDLGIHTQHVPFRMGFVPETVFAKLSKYITERPDGKGGMAPCDTWDNATLVCDARGPEGSPFPLYMETKRLAPGCTDTWFFEIYGLETSAKFTTANPNVFSYAAPWGREQAWAHVNVGYKPMIPTITGGIFEFGFCDAILQMWGAFMGELAGSPPPFPCFTPEETALSHAVYTAALESHALGAAVPVHKKSI
jgi:predicted dehydrogenase